MDAVELGVFSSRLDAVCEEMGLVLQKAAFSSNIRDRLDFSCAIFDAEGQLCAQAAHIPVHLGSMAYAMQSIVAGTRWQAGDQLILNNPFLGGTHLPDVTLVAPVFSASDGDNAPRLLGFVVNRAHHADIGADTPGSMPVSTTIHQEGRIISPSLLYRAGERDEELYDSLTENGASVDAAGDINAQISANLAGEHRLKRLITGLGEQVYQDGLGALNRYGERLAIAALKKIPDGVYQNEDYMDDDGQTDEPVRIRVSLAVRAGHVEADFSGTSPQVRGNINCPESVAAAAVLYVFRCLMPPQSPACAGTFAPVSLRVPEGSLLNAQWPAATAAGNVETSTRIVDVVLGALAKAVPEQIPAASHGSMNNVAMGSNDPARRWSYYETIGGGMGAGRLGGGLSALQTHMTNTLNTPIEVLESRFPLRIERYAVRRGSGGCGELRGGDGAIREYRFLDSANMSLLTERRRLQPWGLNGGCDGMPGVNRLNGEVLPGKCNVSVQAGDVLCVETPGGGGFGSPQDSGQGD